MVSEQFPGNPYVDPYVESCSGLEEQEAATLALAYEQRTANLIALHAFDPTLTLRRQIDARLGLEERN